MAIAALHGLDDDRTLTLERSAAQKEFFRRVVGFPRIHVRRPGRGLAEVGQQAEREIREDDGHHRDRAPPPALLAGSVEKRQGKKDEADDRRSTQQNGGFHPVGHQGRDGEDP